MKRIATMMALALLVGAMNIAWAQPVRNGQDVIWARDVAGATITMDGVLDEAVWDQAETLNLEWGEIVATPGSGYQIEGSPVPAEPTDPTVATLRVLRDGNVLWLGVEVDDASVGGGLSLFNFDGLMMSITDRSQRPEDFAAREDANYFANGVTNAEFFYTWWNPADTTDGTTTYDNGTVIPAGSPTPGIEPRFFGDYGVGFNQGNDGDNRDAADIALWDAVTTVDGIANDDTHGDDEGYVIEMMIDLGAMGYDMTQAGGDIVPWSFAIQDDDYSWPENMDLSFLSRTFWQSKWGNNFNEGLAYIYGDPGVTVSSGAAPEVTEPVVTIGSASLYGAPVIDGSLDDDVWNVESAITLQYEMSAEMMDMLPGAYAPYGVSWFRPDINGDGRAAIVVDPSVATAQFAFEDNTLYIGVDVADAAISGFLSENGRDGVRFTIQTPDSFQTDQTWAAFQFDFTVDSTGALVYANDALNPDTQGAADGITAAVSLKGASTVADPTDVDEGYQIEIAMDLVEVLGYPDGLGEGQLYFGMNFFDGDILESETDSYATRTWLGSERNTGASLYAYLDPNTVIGTATDDGADVPEGFALRGNYPNPFNPSTTLSYTLSQAGNVTLFVYDVLGRRVAEQVLGAQAAGEQRVAFDGKNLGSGVYFYRLQVQGADKGAFMSPVGRMVLLK